MYDSHDDDLDHDMLDVDFISSQSSTSPSHLNLPSLSDSNQRVLAYINSTFEQVTSALSAESPEESRPEVVLKRATSLENQSQDHGDYRQATDQCEEKLARHQCTIYSWLGKTDREAWHFACLLAILLEIKVALEEGITMTKREIYYRQPELFGKQEIVDKFIDDIAFTCGITRKDLRVTASPKGLHCGLSADDEVLIAPEDLSWITQTTVSHLRWILVIEKEASFKTLVEHAMQRSSVVGHGLIVTGKGYPDLNTKRFLRHICDKTSFSIPMFGLFDSDPDGLEIYRCYRSGSKRLSQESSSNLKEMRWLGIDVGDFLDQPTVMNAALNLTLRDRGKARSILRREDSEKSTERDNSTKGTRRMLQFMLMLNVKMEIQCVEHIEGGVHRWLTQKICMV